MIEAINIKKNFGQVEVLKGIDLNINKGEIVSIVGASGAGKTTLLQILGTLLKPDEGTIKIDNQELQNLTEKKLAKFRNQKIGFVFQFHHLLPEFTALENVCIPGFIAKRQKGETEEAAIKILNFLKMDSRKDHKPAELSGGEKQRVAIARALINNPAVVFADEPTGNLDSNNSEEFYNLIFKLREEFKNTFVIVTHNHKHAGMADKTLSIKDGIIEK